MAKLTSKARNALPLAKFALSGRRFPINDKAHARNALARASQGVNRGTLSKVDEAKIDAAAHAVLGSGYKHGSKR